MDKKCAQCGNTGRFVEKRTPNGVYVVCDKCRTAVKVK